MKPLRRVSVNENDPDYCPWLHCGDDGMGDIKVYLKDAPDAKLYFEAVDQVNRTATIFVFDEDGKKVIVGDECLRATLTNVDIVIEMSDDRREEINYWFTAAKEQD